MNETVRTSPAAASPEHDPTAFQVLNEIGIINQLSATAFERTMPDGMTMAQFSVLNHFVRLGGPRNQVDLARVFQVTKGAMTNTVGKLSGKGLVSVVDDPSDKRAKLVDITDAGRAMRSQCLERLAPRLAEVSEIATQGEWEAALPLLRRLRRWLDENR